MPEIRLGSENNLANVTLGSVQIEEVRYGSKLVWLNNAGPEFNIVGAGTYTYRQNVSLVVSNVTDFENPTGPFTYMWEARNVGGSYEVIPGATSPVYGLPRGPQPAIPAGADIDDYLYTKDFRVSVTDPAGGVTTKVQRVTIVDAEDQVVVGGWTNTSNRSLPMSQEGGNKFVTDVINTSCVDPVSTRIVERHIVDRNFYRQEQSRTCTVVQYGAPDSSPKTCAGVQVIRTIDVNTSETTRYDGEHSRSDFDNPNYIAPGDPGYSTIVESNEITVSEDSTCTGIDTTVGCGPATVNCTGEGTSTRTRTTTFYEQAFDCLGVPLSPRDIVDTTTDDQLIPCTQNYSNPTLLNYFILSSGCGNRLDDDAGCAGTDRSNMRGTLGQTLSVTHTWTHNSGGAITTEPSCGSPCSCDVSGLGTSTVTNVVSWVANYEQTELAGYNYAGTIANTVTCSSTLSHYD